MTIINDDFMLTNTYAKTLYEKYAKDMPIFDFHCHLEAKEIYENKKFENISQVWLGGDHYKWRVMRAMGIDEKEITGDTDSYTKFLNWAKTVPNLIGNPLYHWTHLELKRFFGIDKLLNEKNAKEIWDKTNELLQKDEFRPKSLIEKSNVWAVCTTNDPLDDLKYHELLAEDKSFKTKILPAFRPDKLLNIEKDSFREYIKEFEKITGVEIKDKKSLLEALDRRIDFFEKHLCKASDHALNYVPYKRVGDEKFKEILNKALRGEKLNIDQIDAYKTEILIHLANEYYKRDWAMELHIAALRDNSKKMFGNLGPDVGNDAVNDYNYAENLANLLSDIEEKGMPKTILFSLNPKDLYVLSTIAGSFQGGIEGVCKMQLGTSWWFLDHKDGMIEQMKVFSLSSVFSKFIGMLTDSRSFLSYPRHEYFRRILCNYIGELVENGEYPWDEEFLGQVVKNISFNNAKEYIKVDGK